MDIKHTYHTASRFIAAHGHAIEGATLAFLLMITVTAGELNHRAHFLQIKTTKPAVSSSSSVRSSYAHSLTFVQKRDRRLKARLQKQVVARTTNIAQATPKPYLVLEDLRPAAEEVVSSSSISRRPAPVILEISSAASFSSATASSSSTSESSVSSLPDEALPTGQAGSAKSGASFDSFPAFGRAMHPVYRVPNWGAMTEPAEWNRTYKQLTDADFVRVPSYNMTELLKPMDELVKDRMSDASIKTLTAKLYYSTRHFGAYDLDAGEFSAIHPGIDLKLAEGTPVGAVAGGRVHDVRKDEDGLGLFVLIEHRAPDGQTYYSIYGHLGAASVKKGDTIEAGKMVGTVGMSGFTSGPHLHFQIDRGQADEAAHVIYWPVSMPSRATAERSTINPILFIRQYADGQ